MPNEAIHPIRPKKKAAEKIEYMYVSDSPFDLRPDKKPPAPAKKFIPTPWNAKVPPSERVSIYGTQKPSTESDWTCKPGAGWVHASELDTFSFEYMKSYVSTNWFKKHEMIRTQERHLIHMSEIGHPDIYPKDEYEGSPFLVANKFIGHGIKVFNDNGKEVVVSNGTIESYFLLCEELVHYYPSDRFIKIKNRDGGLHCVSIKYWKSKCITEDGNEREGAKYVRCSGCEKIDFVEAMPIRRELGGRFCDKCYKQRKYANAVRAHDDRHFLPKIHEKRFNLLKGVKTEIQNPRLFGVECELGFSDQFVREQIAREINDLMGVEFCYMKHDGSINNHGKLGDGIPHQGFEIVTAPADIEVHRRKWPILESYPNYKHLRSWDTSTCGMHVHVSKDALSCLQIGRILVFINHPENKKFVQQVAGRGELKWTRYYDKGLTSSLHPEASGDRDMDRRVAVNLQNPNTVEFRIFRGTINPRHIIRNIEFVDAVCDFCWPCDRSFKELLDYKNFIRFCDQNRKRYPLFAEWAAAEKHIRARKLKPGAKPIEVEELRPKKKQMNEAEF
jgi:hypothetical protein